MKSIRYFLIRLQKKSNNNKINNVLSTMTMIQYQQKQHPSYYCYPQHYYNYYNTSVQKNKTSIEDIVKEQIEKGLLIHDIQQIKIAKKLSRLQKALIGYSNESIIQRIEEEQRVRKNDYTQTNTNDDNNNTIHEEKKEDNVIENHPIMVPRGLFIHGNVGVGKSYIMDLFYDNVQLKNNHLKRRVHFHSFMQDIHQRIHELKKYDLETKGRNFTIDTSFTSNPINKVAMKLADEVSLLCFDEFQVTDVADALILSQLFSILFNRGTVVVATSNRHPSTLYEGGINRGYFLPFIDLLCRHCIVHDMNATNDYRSIMSDGVESLFFNKSSEKDYIRFKNVLLDIWGHENVIKKTINVAFNRQLQVNTKSDANIAKFDFRDLCNNELGSSDYRAIAQQFDIIIVENVPQLSVKEHDQARRFITLIDELYEADCVLLCCATATNPSDLFNGNKRNDHVDVESKDKITCIEEPNIEETLGIDVAQSNGVALGELASVRELSFAFLRAASRLKEMCSKQNWAKKGIIL